QCIEPTAQGPERVDLKAAQPASLNAGKNSARAKSEQRQRDRQERKVIEQNYGKQASQGQFKQQSAETGEQDAKHKPDPVTPIFRAAGGQFWNHMAHEKSASDRVLAVPVDWPAGRRPVN